MHQRTGACNENKASRPCSPIPKPRSLRLSSGPAAARPAHCHPANVQRTKQGPGRNSKLSRFRRTSPGALQLLKPSFLAPPDFLDSRKALVAPLMAPQAVCPSTKISRCSVHRRRTPGCQARCLSMRARCSQHCAGQRGPQERHRRRFSGARGNLHNQPEQCGEPGPSCSNPHACSGEPCQLRGHPPRSAHCHPSAWPGHPHRLALGGLDWATLDGRRHRALGPKSSPAAPPQPSPAKGPRGHCPVPGLAGW